MKTYRTESGSIYDVEGMMVRRRVRSPLSKAERVSGEWREAEKIDFPGVGHSMVIVWGVGVDEHSEHAEVVGFIGDPTGMRVRTTWTTPIVEVLESPESN